MELRYEKNGDYLIPMLKRDEQPEGVLTKYGMMRRTYLKENERGLYSAMLLENSLMKHLLEVQEQAEERMEFLTKQMMKQEGVTEQLKAENQLLWVQKMNNIRATAEESILAELIYN